MLALLAAHQACATAPWRALFLDDFDQLHLAAFRVERADLSEPLLEPELPWDAGTVHSHGTVLRDPLDGGKYKAWYVSTPRGCHGDGPCAGGCKRVYA